MLALKGKKGHLQEGVMSTVHILVSVFINRNKRARASWAMAVNLMPMPLPGWLSQIKARARTSPPGTSKTSLIVSPVGGGCGVVINRPPRAKTLAVDTARFPKCSQATSVPFGNGTRAYLRAFLVEDIWTSLSFRVTYSTTLRSDSKRSIVVIETL